WERKSAAPPRTGRWGRTFEKEENLPEEGPEGPLVVVVVTGALLVLLLLEGIGRLGLGVLLVQGHRQLELLLIADDGEHGGVPGLIVGGQGGGEGGGGVHGGVVDSGDDVVDLQAGLLGAGAL